MENYKMVFVFLFCYGFSFHLMEGVMEFLLTYDSALLMYILQVSIYDFRNL